MKYNLQIDATLYPQSTPSYLITDKVIVRDLSFFQVCVILGGLQNLIEMEQDQVEI